jgi:predicted metal-binding protein
MAIEKQPTPWSEALITICEKCAKSLPALELKEEGSASENLKKYLKGRFKDSDAPKRMRVVTSSCLDVCIKNAVAVSYNPAWPGKMQKTFTVHPEADREELFQLLSEEKNR